MFLVIYIKMAAAFLHHPPHHHHHHHHHSSSSHHSHHQNHKLYHDSVIRDSNNNDSTVVNNNNNHVGKEIFYSWQQSSIIGKRKSAVELLQETKPLYVKSETVLDRRQQLSKKGSYLSVCGQTDDDNSNHSLSYYSDTNNNNGPATCPPFLVRSFSAFNSSPPAHIDGNSNNYRTSTLPLPKSPKLIPPPSVFRKSTGSYQLQNDLRKLLIVSKEDLVDSTENISEYNEENNADDGIFHSENKDYGDNFSDDSEMQQYLSSYKSNRSSTRQHIDFNCHKSLPDLSANAINFKSLSTPHDYKERCHYSLSPNDGMKMLNEALHNINSDAISVASCKNDRLFIRENDVTDTQHTDVISPPSLYSDFKIQNVLSPTTTTLITSRPLRPILRSKSDVSGTRKIPSPSEVVALTLLDPEKLDDFFDHLGMDADRYNRLLTTSRSDTSSPVYFKTSSDSSTDSIGGYASSGGCHDPVNINYNVEVPSIVERNARIIKWLCNCRKAMTESDLTTSNNRHVSN